MALFLPWYHIICRLTQNTIYHGAVPYLGLFVDDGRVQRGAPVSVPGQCQPFALHQFLHHVQTPLLHRLVDGVDGILKMRKLPYLLRTVITV